MRRCDIGDLHISVLCASAFLYYIRLFQNIYPGCEEHQQGADQDSTTLNYSVNRGTRLSTGVAAFKRETGLWRSYSHLSIGSLTFSHTRCNILRGY